jgi:hypothetical protein
MLRKTPQLPPLNNRDKDILQRRIIQSKWAITTVAAKDEEEEGGALRKDVTEV